MNKITFERVDAHCHLWEFDLAGKWIGADWPVDMRRTWPASPTSPP